MVIGFHVLIRAIFLEIQSDGKVFVLGPNSCLSKSWAHIICSGQDSALNPIKK